MLFRSQDLFLFDKDGLMPQVEEGSRLTVFEDVDDTVLFGGVVGRIQKSLVGYTSAGAPMHQFTVSARGYQHEADSIGIEEQPVFKQNAGAFIRRLVEKYTTLEIGEIDTENSPTLDVIRLSPITRFSEACRLITSYCPNYEFFISNEKSNGRVFFRPAGTSVSQLKLDDAFIRRMGPRNVNIVTDIEKTYNIVRLPFYRIQRREPDFFIQDTVTDPAFLKTSITLNGQPSYVEQSVLMSDDFSDGDLADGLIEDDLPNPAPPTGYTGSDGYLIEGVINGVPGLHLLNPASFSGTVRLGDIACSTDPLVGEPFTGQDRQRLMLKEIVISTAGDCVFMGLLDQTTYQTQTIAGSTTTTLKVADNSFFSVDDRIDVDGEKAYVQAKSGKIGRAHV